MNLEKDSAKEFIQYLIQQMGDDPYRHGLKDTPKRVIESWKDLYSGYKFPPEYVQLMLTQFDGEGYDELVLLKDVEFYSTCEHHLLPFFGKAYIAYIPDKKIVGISKLARLLEIYSRRLQVQERICQKITQDLMTYLNAKGAACVLEGRHLCMCARGVQKQNSIMVTSSLTGCMKDKGCRAEFFGLIGK